MQGNPTVQQNLDSCPFEEAGTGGETAILIHVSTAMMFAAQKLEKRSVYLSHPTDTASAQTDCLLLKTAREGDASLREKKKSPGASIFLLSPLSPGNKPCKAVHAENGVCCASPHLTWQTCKNVCRQNEQIHDVWQEGGFC